MSSGVRCAVSYLVSRRVWQQRRLGYTPRASAALRQPSLTHIDYVATRRGRKFRVFESDRCPTPAVLLRTDTTVEIRAQRQVGWMRVQGFRGKSDHTR